ncbi:uncharacterized protein ddias [Sphaeramia orbicularis]|uniref:Replication factor A C-terminal domain-containing protein n=1 Tax=Sphaeramia orbicularis TaxID=375764 RepID=A0A673BPE7_9TELE|nr:DNA damage-induced apoptosis suppressor protein [Sphaeramia orbicularis]
MPVKRALVDCAVLSLQDACVFYPYCKGCLSKIDPEPLDPTRLSCFKCGYSCLREQVDYRYRLSVKVARNTCIFGITVFGTCLNPFFGTHASGLQRLVEDLSGPVEVSTRSTLLLKAVQDCFIGRHFIFGIKVTETENVPWLEGTKVSSSNNTVQFIASQMILPKARCLEGCTVVSYYQTLVQKAAEYELESRDPCKTPRPPATPLMLVPCHSSNSSLCNATLCASGYLSQSLQRSQQQDSVLSPTPPWQQSMGLVTSSAEQQENCGTQDNDNEYSRIITDIKTPHRTQSFSAKNGTAERRLSCLFSLQSRFSAQYQFSCLENAAGNTPVLPRLSSSPSGHTMALQLSSKAKGSSAEELTQNILTDSLALEDLPFSESLTEFLCEDDKVSEKSEKNHKESRRFLDITNRAAVNNGGERHELSEVACYDTYECVNTSQTGDVHLHQCDQQDVKADSENDEEGSVYNCSADLFSCSSDMDRSTKMHHSMALETLKITPSVIRNTETLHTYSSAEVRSLHCKSDKEYPKNGTAHVTPSTPDKQNLKRSKSNTRDSLGTQDYLQTLEFIPPSQSTPVVKVSLVSGSREKPQKISSPICRVNCVSSNSLEFLKEDVVCSTTYCRHSNKFTPKRSFWKSDKHKLHFQAQQQVRFRRGALNTGSRRRTNQKYESDVSVCDYEDKEVIVPPTPAAKTHLNTKIQRSKHANTSSFTWGGQWVEGEKNCCKRKLLEQTVRTESDPIERESNVCCRPCNGEISECDFISADKEVLEGCNTDLLGDENEECNWSRDLFSD